MTNRKRCMDCLTDIEEYFTLCAFCNTVRVKVVEMKAAERPVVYLDTLYTDNAGIESMLHYHGKVAQEEQIG